MNVSKTHCRERRSATTHINDKIHRDHLNTLKKVSRFEMWSHTNAHTHIAHCYYLLNVLLLFVHKKQFRANLLRARNNNKNRKGVTKSEAKTIKAKEKQTEYEICSHARSVQLEM